MGECSMLASDCVALSCCCQCWIMQIVILIFFKLPCNLFLKATEYVKQKLQNRRQDKRIESIDDGFQEELVEIHEWSIKIPQVVPGEDQGYESCMEEDHGYQNCMEEVDKVLWELSQKGEFAFGSFWGKEVTGVFSADAIARQKSDLGVVQIQQIELVDIVASFRHSY